MKERGEQWLVRVRAAHAALAEPAFREALAAEFDWFNALTDHEEGNGEKLAALMQSDRPIPAVAREHIHNLLTNGKPPRARNRPKKARAGDVVHMVLFCKVKQRMGFCNKDGAEGNESFAVVADLYQVTPDYIRKMFYSVPKKERDRIERAFSARRQ